jgi:hypothetical protein
VTSWQAYGLIPDDAVPSLKYHLVYPALGYGVAQIMEAAPYNRPLGCYQAIDLLEGLIRIAKRQRFHVLTSEIEGSEFHLCDSLSSSIS